MPVVGFLPSGPDYMTAFREGLKEAGFVEGQDVAIEYRSAVAELLRRQVALIVGNTPAALAAKAVTTTVPIVFATGGDPVRDGLVTNLNRPGGNATGVSFISADLGAKQQRCWRRSTVIRSGARSRSRAARSRCFTSTTLASSAHLALAVEQRIRESSALSRQPCAGLSRLKRSFCSSPSEP
jgi:hypothetical protein